MLMTAGVPGSPREATTGFSSTMNKDTERGEKRGVLSTGRAKDQEDANTDAADVSEGSGNG